VNQPVIDRSSGAPPYRQLCDFFREKIRSGGLCYGAKLPSVRQMVQTLSLSNTTIQKSLHMLKEEGWLIGRRGEGVFVAGEAPGLAVSATPELWVERLPLDDANWARLMKGFQARNPQARVVESYGDSDLSHLQFSLVPQRVDALADLTGLVESCYGRESEGAELFDPMRMHGSLYLFPTFINVHMYALDRGRFEALGVPVPSPDWGWAELLETARALSRPSQGFTGIAIPPHWAFFLPLVWQAGGAIYTADGRRCLLDSESGREAAAFLRELARYGAMEVRSEGQSDLFAGGRAGIMATGTWGYYDLNHSHHSWVARPVARGRERATWVSMKGYTLSRRSQHKEMAREFLREVSQIELWPDHVDKRSGLPLQKRLESNGQDERLYRESLRAGRTWISDVAPECRRPAHESALNAISRYVAKIAFGAEPLERLLRALSLEIEYLLTGDEEDHGR